MANLWRIVSFDNTTTITIINDERIEIIKQDHINFDKIKQTLESGNYSVDSIFDMCEVSKTITKKFKPLTEKISINNGKIYIDNDEVDNTLTREIIRFVFLDDSSAVNSLVHFMDKLYENIVPSARIGLYDWMKANGLLTITDEGNFIAYKGVTDVYSLDGTLQSSQAGKGIVNGVFIERGHLDNTPGNMVEFPRSEIDTSRDELCSIGLHVGTFEYANSFYPHVVACEVDPRDVVTIPRDYEGAKIRVCRYKVLAEVTEKLNEAIYRKV